MEKIKLPEGVTVESDIDWAVVSYPPNNMYAITVEASSDEEGDLRIHVPDGLTVSAKRGGDGNGHCFVMGPGDGHAFRHGRGHGNAERGGAGYGSAIRSGEGDGDARRERGGPGDAERTGHGDGDAMCFNYGEAKRVGVGKGKEIDSCGERDALEAFQSSVSEANPGA